MSTTIATQILAATLSLHDLALILEAVERACERHGSNGDDVAFYAQQARFEAEHGHKLAMDELEREAS